MKIIRFIPIIYVLLISFSTISQKRKFKFPSFDVVRSGPYIGLQTGKFNNLELGFEQQWKDLKLFGPKTTAIFGGLNYNIFNGVIGEDLGIWKKLGLMGITYGISFNHRTNFTFHKIGFSPMIGLKLGKFHSHFGYQFLFPDGTVNGVNEFYICLRYKVWSNKKIVKE